MVRHRPLAALDRRPRPGRERRRYLAGDGRQVRWQSGPAGRGRVSERVVSYEPLGGQTVEVQDASIHGTQTVSFVAEDANVVVTLTLSYELTRRSPLMRVVDLLFIRRAMTRSLEQTLARLLAPSSARHGVGTWGSVGRMFVFKAGVVGAGIMGGEIAHAIANADVPVVLKDVDQRFVDRGMEKARSLWHSRVEAGKLEPSEFERKLALITPTTSYEEFGEVDFVVEATPERIELKRRGLRRAR